MNFENNNFEPTEYLPYDFANRRHIGPSPQTLAYPNQAIFFVLWLEELSD